MHRVLLINGPPRAGKDEAAKVLIMQGNAHIERFSNPLKNSICSWIGVTRGSDQELIMESGKDQPDERLGGLSYREAQIDLSERYLKPLYGKDCFGKWMRERLTELHRIHDRARLDSFTVIPDSGFVDEALALIGMRNTHIALLQVHRPGSDFSKDSRSYIEVPSFHTIAVYNNGTLADYHGKITDVVRDWVRLTP